MSVNFPELREFQGRAHQALRQGFKDGHKNQLVMAPTGSGKTLLAMWLIHEAMQKNKQAVFVCDRTALINQTSSVADGLGLTDHGIVQAQHWRRDTSRPLQIASVQTIAKRGYWPEADLLIIDECFPEGTQISTPSGDIPIEQVRTLLSVHNAMGCGVVKGVFKKTTNSLITLGLSNGQTIQCTPDHPIFTGNGWEKASALGIGSRLYSIEAVRLLWEGDDSTGCQGVQREDDVRGGVHVQSSSVLRSILRQEAEEPDAQLGDPLKSHGCFEENWAQATSTRRKRKGNDGTAGKNAQPTGLKLDTRVCGKNPSEKQGWIPSSLQDRPCKSCYEAGSGTGWVKPSLTGSSGSGFEEGQFATQIRVESIKVTEFPSGVNVYNLRVTGHPSYFANGILVHNCHCQYKAWVEHANQTDAAVIGLSATPFSRGLGKVFTNLINVTSMDELTKQGILVPLKVFSCTKINMKDAPKGSDGEWTDKAAEERGKEIVGDVVSEWLKLSSDRKTIVFGATIAHCQEICKKFIDAGVMAALYTSETKQEERNKLVEEFKKPDSFIRVLISVAALEKGFDQADVSCIVDCRPLTKSISTAIQMWGRGLRSAPGKLDCRLHDHSGNIIRMGEDFTDVYFNGLESLDDGEKLDKKQRDKGEDEPVVMSCPQCGHNPFFRRCMACGFEKVKPAMVENVPGEMKEIIIGKKKLADDNRHLWEQVCAYARQHSAPEKQAGRAWHLYEKILGYKPASTWSFSTTQPVEVTPNVYKKIQSLNIAYQYATKGIRR